MLTHYPAIKPYEIHRLAVDEPHTLYVEESGSPDGFPILFVHGGPGAGTEAIHRRYFDPEKYRIILFDQRGCGQSMPHAGLQDNTSHHLISDIEAIREYLKIDRWALLGGSWGATLSLLYAQTHPERVLGLILRGTFLGREQDIRWFYQQGASEIFPDYWEEFIAPIHPDERDDLISAYHQRLTGPDDLVRMGAAKAWSTWEGRCATLDPHQKVIDFFKDPFLASSLAALECHYFKNHCFIEPNQILNNMNKIHNIPGMIIHGRYDIICPVSAAWTLHKAWPKAELDVIRTAGHSASEPAIIDALVRATQKLHATVTY